MRLPRFHFNGSASWSVGELYLVPLQEFSIQSHPVPSSPHLALDKRPSACTMDSCATYSFLLVALERAKERRRVCLASGWKFQVFPQAKSYAKWRQARPISASTSQDKCDLVRLSEMKS